MAELFGLLPDIECVLLNACYSAVQAKAISEKVPAVIGMQDTISDKAALTFSVAFYDALGAGEDIALAHNLARNRLHLSGLVLDNAPEHLTPILLNASENRGASSESAKPPQPEPTLIHLIHDYLLPNNFTGRTKERKTLNAFLRGTNERKTSVTAICALGGMGKSCLARQTLEDLTNPASSADIVGTAVRGENTPYYQHVVWFSFYEARTEDEAYAFREILTRFSPDAAKAPEALDGAALGKYLRNQLCRYLDEHPVLLVLDGLEVIQHTDDPHSPHYGQIRNTHKETLQLIRHCCNQSRSRALITTRVPLNNLEGAVGYTEIQLPLLSNQEAAEYLGKLEVSGTKEELLYCAELFGGHPLCLKAAGIQMQRRRIPAAEVERLVGNPELFKRSNEGERVAKIVDTHRAELSPEQEYFLQMLSIHPRSVTQRHFPALVKDFGIEQRDAYWVKNEIIFPLETCGLIEVLDAVNPNDQTYRAHPLMKLAFTNWLNPTDRHKAHEQWAQAAQASPALTDSPSNANNLEALQPWLDVIEHYLAAEDWDSAWYIYSIRGVNRKLMHLAYFHHLQMLSLRFDQALKQGWSLASTQQSSLYNSLALASHGLSLRPETLKYQKKSFFIAQAFEKMEDIAQHGSILAEIHLICGHLKEARAILSQIHVMANKVQTDGVMNFYQRVLALADLIAGNYSKALRLYEKVVKSIDNTYHQIIYNYELGETQIYMGLFSAAEKTLGNTLKEAEEQHIIKHIPRILDRLTLLAIKQKKLDKARSYNDRRIIINKSLDLPGQEDYGFLLIAEGNYTQALNQAETKLERIHAEGVDKVGEIMNLLILSQAYQGLGKTAASKHHCQQARELMEQTGCWIFKDWLVVPE